MANGTVQKSRFHSAMLRRTFRLFGAAAVIAATIVSAVSMPSNESGASTNTKAIPASPSSHPGIVGNELAPGPKSLGPDATFHPAPRPAASDASSVTTGIDTPGIDPDTYSCNKSGYVDFEQYPDQTNLSATSVPGVQFTTTNGYTWMVGDFASGAYNGKYPNGDYTSQGTHWAWLGENEGAGQINFPGGPASSFSLLVSASDPVELEAYDSSNDLLATAGPTSSNIDSGTTDELAINSQSADIAYVLVEGTGNYFLVDAVCTDAPGVQYPPAESWLTTATQTAQASPISITPVTSGTVNLNPQTTQQTLDGFGVTLTNSSAAVLESLPPAALTQTLDSLFNPQTGGGISAVRLSMGANDFSTNGCVASAKTCPSGKADYTYDDVPQSNSPKGSFCRKAKTDPNLECFNINPYDDQIIDVLNSVEQLNPKPQLTLIASPWSAPKWMKKGNNLATANYAAYADYFVDYIEEMQEETGLTINYVTPQNEPGTSSSSYPTMTFTPTEEQNFVDNYLSPALSDAGLSTQILDYDWNWYAPGTPNGTCQNKKGSEGTNGCWTEGDLTNLLTGAPANVAGLAWHCYSAPAGADVNGKPGPSVQEAVAPGSTSFMTECTGKDSPKIGDTNFGYDLAWDSSYLIAGGLDNGSSGVLFYNLALNQDYGPQSGGNCKNLCRGVVTINTTTQQVTDNVEYWLLTETARAFQSDATVISTDSSASACASMTNLCVTAAVNPNGTTGLYVANPTSSPISFSVDDDGYGFSYPNLPGRSVVSFQWTNP